MTRICVVNDDTDFLTLMCQLLAIEGYEPGVIRESQQAYQRLRGEKPDLIILDIRMGSPEQGWNICELLTLDPETRHIPIIICSAAVDQLRDKQDWLQQHGITTLPKPFDIDDLCVKVRESLARGETGS